MPEATVPFLTGNQRRGDNGPGGQSSQSRLANSEFSQHLGLLAGLLIGVEVHLAVVRPGEVPAVAGNAADDVQRQALDLDDDQPQLRVSHQDVRLTHGFVGSQGIAPEAEGLFPSVGCLDRLENPGFTLFSSAAKAFCCDELSHNASG